MKFQKKLIEHNWNFNADRVPDDELVACCYWENARESGAICDAVKTAKTAHANLGKSAPMTAERQAFDEVVTSAYGLLHQTGYELQFWVGLPFPEKPWQLIGKTERKKWGRICPEISAPVKFPPFQTTGDLFIASWLYGEATKAREARLALYRRLLQIDSGAANLAEAAELRNKLDEQAKHPTPPVEMQGMGGVDSFIAQINWHEFSKKEIIKCFSKWVNDYRCPLEKPSERGRPVDWRARLERLGLLRLRHHHTLENAKPYLQKLYPPCRSMQSRPPSKFNDGGECNREANRAVEDFRNLFPFLGPSAMPHSWPMK
jgi:hypothetical protein